MRYRVTSGGRPAEKSVTYWSMRATEGEFVASREVDDMRWLPLDSARTLLTSASDRNVLDSFVLSPRDTRPLLLVRHAATATPARRLKRHAIPPGLSKSGRAQAQALVPVLEGLGVTRLLSADLPACAQTLAPFAASSGVAVRREALLTGDGFSANEHEAADEVRRDAAARETVVVCGQQRVIAGLLTTLGEGRESAALGDRGAQGRLVAAAPPRRRDQRVRAARARRMTTNRRRRRQGAWMKSHLEIEAKYDVADGQPLPDLANVGQVDSVAAADEMVLTATYFDTPAHSLSSAGATLRRRTGGEDDGWHLKLSVADGERLEVHRPLGRAQTPPAALTSLVRAFLGPGRPRRRRDGSRLGVRSIGCSTPKAGRLPSSPTTR